MIGFLVYHGLRTRVPELLSYFNIILSRFYRQLFYSADYVLNNVMVASNPASAWIQPGASQVLMKTSAGAGYNVHQSEIAIGSGGLQGKGYP